MPTRILLGPSFEDFTMTSDNFRWLHSCRWEAAHCESFLILRSKLSYAIDSAPKLLKSKQFDEPEIAAQWLLVDEFENAEAWAELQRFSSAHDSFGILFWARDDDDNQDSFDTKHLARLISFSFLIGKFDRMKIVEMSLSKKTATSSLAEGIGELRTTYSLSRHAWFPNSSGALIGFQTLDLAREEWEGSKSADLSSEQLKQISIRVERFEKAQLGLSPKRKRRSLIARLFHPKLDDTLF